jgi:hypothetical protein
VTKPTRKKKAEAVSDLTVPGAQTLECLVMRAATDEDVGAVYGGLAVLSLLDESAAKEFATQPDGELDLDLYSKLLDIVEKKQRIRMKSAQMIHKASEVKQNNHYVVAPEKWTDAVEAHELQ